MSDRPILQLEPCAKRIRVMVAGKTVADSLCTILVLERGHWPVYYFPREDVRMVFLAPTEHHTRCPQKGEASYWSLKVADRVAENAVWSYEAPTQQASRIKGFLAFTFDKVDHWFEEDEEIFGHPRDPYHRIDVRPSSRVVRAILAGETIAMTRRGLFLFETGLPTRYYIPPQDIRMDLLTPSSTISICPYKGQASYYSAGVGGVHDLAWSYLNPLPECPRIRGYLCFYPEKIDRLEVEGEQISLEARA